MAPMAMVVFSEFLARVSVFPHPGRWMVILGSDTSNSLKDARLDRRTTHEFDIGTGLADVAETRDKLFSPQDRPGAIDIAGRFDDQVGFPVGGVTIQKITRCPIYDGKEMSAQDGASAVLAGLNQQRHLKNSAGAPYMADDIVFFEPGGARSGIAQDQTHPALLDATGLQNPGDLGVGAWIEIGAACQGRLAPGPDGIAILLVARQSCIILVGEDQVGAVQFPGDLIGMVTGIREAETGLAFATIDDIELLIGIDLHVAHLGFLSRSRGTRSPRGVGPTEYCVIGRVSARPNYDDGRFRLPALQAGELARW